MGIIAKSAVSVIGSLLAYAVANACLMFGVWTALFANRIFSNDLAFRAVFIAPHVLCAALIAAIAARSYWAGRDILPAALFGAGVGYMHLMGVHAFRGGVFYFLYAFAEAVVLLVVAVTVFV